MFANLLLSGLILVCCVLIQTFFVVLLLRLLFRVDEKNYLSNSILRDALFLSCITLIMLCGIVVQMLIWAGFFLALGEFDSWEQAFYHSAVNFTTLGYGDVIMSADRRVLGALEAANGVLMFGFTTSVLFAVMAVLIRRRWSAEKGSDFWMRII